MRTLVYAQHAHKHTTSNTGALLSTGSFAIGEYIDAEALDRLQLMHTDIYYEYALAMTSKTWPLKDELDTLIASVVQSGIQAMWEWQVRFALPHSL